MPLEFLKLPPELLINILTYLVPQDLVAIQLSCSPLHTLIKSSSLLQYNSALRSLGLIDNQSRNCDLPLNERLRLLKEREKAWCNLETTFITDVPVQHNPSGIYDLTGGVYLLGDLGRKSLYWCRLPGREEELQEKKTEWRVVNLQNKVVDMALAVYEHDMLAVVTTHPTPSTHEIELSFYSLSTGLPHPHARHARIPILNSQHEKPAVGLEIVGRHLVLVLSWYTNDPVKPDNDLFTIEWMQGEIKMHVTRPYGTYSSIVHLTEHIFVLPNAQQFTLEFWHIPRDAGDPIPTEPDYVLGLPRLGEGRIVGSISCRGEPNPVGERYEARDSRNEASGSNGESSRTGDELIGGTFVHCTKPFLPNPMESIIIFNIRILPTLPQFFALGLIGNTFTFFVHRRALLNLYLRRHEIELDPGSASPTATTSAANNNHDQEEEEPEAPLLNQDQDILYHPPPAPAVSSHTTGPTPVPFDTWAPPITRWLNSDILPTRWITTTCGQRCVLIANQDVAEAGTRGFPLVVLDFNPDRVRRQQSVKKEEAQARLGRGRERFVGDHVDEDRNEESEDEEDEEEDEDRDNRWGGERGAKVRTRVVTQPEAITSGDAFMEGEIRTGLPYVATATSEAFSFEGVLMDEERILGINTDMLDRIQSVRVHYFG